MTYKRTKTRKAYQDLTFTDDYMFCKVLSNDLELCRQLLELILEKDIRKVELADAQHEISITSDIKSVRLDVFLNDEDGTVFDLEMQTVSRRILPRRSRYYHSISDIDYLTSGASYAELPDSYVIFICTFDPFEAGLARYEFRNLCIGDSSIELGDGTCKVFINAKSSKEQVSGEMRAFLDYLCGKEPTSELTHYIADSIRAAKGNKTWERDFMRFEELLKEEKAESLKEGIALGRQEGETLLAELSRLLIKAGRYDDLETALDDAEFRHALYREFGLEQE